MYEQNENRMRMYRRKKQRWNNNENNYTKYKMNEVKKSEIKGRKMCWNDVFVHGNPFEILISAAV